MDKYLEMFSEQLDEAFKPETIFPQKQKNTRDWMKNKFISIMAGDREMKEVSAPIDVRNDMQIYPKA